MYKREFRFLYQEKVKKKPEAHNVPKCSIWIHPLLFIIYFSCISQSLGSNQSPCWQTSSFQCCLSWLMLSRRSDYVKYTRSELKNSLYSQTYYDLSDPVVEELLSNRHVVVCFHPPKSYPEELKLKYKHLKLKKAETKLLFVVVEVVSLIRALHAACNVPLHGRSYTQSRS